MALVGIDSLSIEEYGVKVAGAHLELLGAASPSWRGWTSPGRRKVVYWLMALPLKLTGAEGAPVRAILLEHPEWE